MTKFILKTIYDRIMVKGGYFESKSAKISS